MTNKNMIVSKTISLFFLLFILLTSCKKNLQKNETENNPTQKNSNITKIFLNKYDTEDEIINARNNRVSSAFVPVINSYSITTGCTSNTLDLTDIIVTTGLSRKPNPYYLIINGTTFYPTFISTTGGPFVKFHHYQLLNISLSSIGISDFCNSTNISVDHYTDNTFNTTETLPINEGVSCGSGSYQCITSSPGTGQLSFYLPYISCGCANMYPPTYTFRYRLQGTSTWTNTPVSYSTYFSATTISSLPAGVYEVEGQNTCSQNQSPSFVPAMPSTVTVP